MATHFVLANDIDLAGVDFRIIGNEAIPFAGVFDGNSKRVLNLTYRSTARACTGFFGRVKGLGAMVKDLCLVDPNVDAGPGGLVGSLVGDNWMGTIMDCSVDGGRVRSSDWDVGGLAGYSDGSISGSRATCRVSGKGGVGGLVGWNGGSITASSSSGPISGTYNVGGFVGGNSGSITTSYSSGSVKGTRYHVGGLVGCNHGSISSSYSSGSVNGTESVGGLVGSNGGSISTSYSTGWVSSSGNGDTSVGGLVGAGSPSGTIACFWDIQTSGHVTSAGGTGKTTTEMQKAATFWGWGTCGNEGIWTIDDGADYPRLWWENRPGDTIQFPPLSDLLLGTGTQIDPFLIYTAEDLQIISIFPCEWGKGKHFKLMADIDLDPNLPGGKVFDKAVIAPDVEPNDYDCSFAFQGTPFTGVFEGNDHTISHLTVTGSGYLGLFGRLDAGAEVKDLGVVAVNISGSGFYIGGLVGANGDNDWDTQGNWYTQGGTVVNCYSSGTVSATACDVGGLVGYNNGSIATSYSTCLVSETAWHVGGLVGSNMGEIANCYSTASVSGSGSVGGLVGTNEGSILSSYSSASVSGTERVGGLVGSGHWGPYCFWDTETSGQVENAGGTGKTTAEMQTAQTFLDAGWDFVGETDNGTEDTWWIDEGKDYPRLWWELDEMGDDYDGTADEQR
jgi:hypothetical protein